jgi:glycosyltransferase involved in cell wall biosynthesis
VTGRARKRICIVTNEILGVVKTGGSGTANTFLSFALARAGHAVELLVTAPSAPIALDQRWGEEYASRGITVRLLDPPRPHAVIPGSFGLAAVVGDALEQSPPDVLIVDAWSGAAYIALRLRELGLGFEDMTCVILCNGPTAWGYETDRKLPRSFPAFEVEALERASFQLADAVVSPSRHLLDWMHERGWLLPASFVAPYFTGSAADGGEVAQAPAGGAVRRIAFFGRLEERKGIEIFIAALNGLGPGVMAETEVAFVGRESAQWPVERLERALASFRVRFETELDQPDAIAFLKERGTLAVMPSVLDNSPNVVYECLEHGIPFVTTSVGGIPELIAPEDQRRALVAPTADALRAGLESLLTSPERIHPVRPSFDGQALLGVWEQALAQPRRPRVALEGSSDIAVVVNHYGDRGQLLRCLEAVGRQSYRPRQVLVVTEDEVDLDRNAWPWNLDVMSPAATKRTERRSLALQGAQGELVLLLEDTDLLEDRAVEELVRAQAASHADVVTCATSLHGKPCYYLGEPNELGLVGNYYGSIALGRRSVLERAETPETGGDTDWVLYAALSHDGAKIVSVPRPLATTARSPGDPASDPPGSGAALAVARIFEARCPPELRELPRLAAALAGRRTALTVQPSALARLGWIWEHEGAQGFARRAANLLRRRGLHAGRLARARKPEPEAGRTPDGAHEREREQENGRGQRDSELGRIAGGPRGLAERGVREGNEPHERELRLGERERNEQQQEVVDPHDR